MRLYRFYEIFNFLLLPLSFLYRFLLSLHRVMYHSGIFTVKTFDKKIVSIGNLTVGGTGKTPFVIFLTELLRKRDRKVAIVSLGYKRREKDKIIDIMAERNNKDTGDEPWLISTRVNSPVIVSRDKRDGCSYAINKYKPDIVILDDGFQTFSIKRDLDILLLDASDNFLHSFLLPAGKLREPLNAIKRANIVIITRCNQAERGDIQTVLKIVRKMNPHTPVFYASHIPLTLFKFPEEESLNPSFLKGKNLLAISSIGNNDSFLLTLKSLGLSVIHSIGYLDHHRYSKKDIRIIKKKVVLYNIDAIITTEKDIYSLRFYVSEFNIPLYSLPIKIYLKEEERFEMLLKEKGLS